jgi:hypothetical protein
MSNWLPEPVPAAGWMMGESLTMKSVVEALSVSDLILIP